MANKELTAKVKLDIKDAESKLKRLDSLIKSINKAVTGNANTSKMESTLAKQVIQAEKVKQATLQTKMAQEKLSQEIAKTYIAEEKVTQALAKTTVEQEKVKQAASKTAQELGKEYVAEERVNQALSKTAIYKEKVKQASSKTAQEIGKEFIAEEKVNRELLKTEHLKNKIKTQTDKAVNSANRLRDAFRNSNSGASRLLTTIKRLAATYLGVMGMKATIGVSDTITSTQNRLNNVNGGDKALTQEQMDKMYVSANKSRMNYGDMMSNASKSMVLAGDAFGGKMDNAIRFQEIMAKTYALGGASAAETSSSMYQMIQALGAGTLAGDELRSVREGAPLAYKAIEEFAQGIYNTEESLKDLASQGKITSDMVVAAIMKSGNSIDKQFENTAMTFGQAWDRIKNSAIKAFEPVSKVLNEMLNKAAKNGAFEMIEQAFWNISKAIQIVFTIIYNTIAWIADNWGWLQHVIIAGIILMITYYLIKAGIAIYCAYQEAKAWIIANSAMLKNLLIIAIIIAAVLALVYVFYLWKTGAIDTCQAIVSALLIVGIAIALIGLLLGSWVVAIVGLVIAAIGLIINYLDYFLAVVYSIGAGIWNIIVGVVNAVVQFLWTHFVEPWIGIIEWVLNVFNGGFNSFGDAVQNLLGNIISWFLSLGKVVTKIIDAIFGTNWTDGLNALQDKVLQWGKNEDAITLSREAPDVLNRISYNDAWNTGLEHGNAAKDWLNNLGADYQTGFDGLSLDNLGNKLGLDFGNGFPSVGDPNYDVSGAYNQPSIDELLSGIGDDVGDIKDSIDLTNDDMDYLRKIADMEWRNEFTTAEIKVDMVNHNNVNGERDLDGIVEYLSDVLKSEMTNVAYGVHY